MINFPIYNFNNEFWLADVVLNVKNGERYHKLFRLTDSKVDYVESNILFVQEPVSYETSSYADLNYLVTRLIEEKKYGKAK